jgi:hypothetical protein
MPMTNKGVRVIDPILTTHAQGYRQQEMVGDALFPRVPVGISGGQVLEFGKEAFRLYNARRAPGANTKRVEFGYLGKPFALVQDALEGKLPIEHIRDAGQVPNIQLGQRSVNTVMRSLLLALEVEQSQIARNANNYDADHKVDLSAAKWSTTDGDPAKDVRAGREAIRETIGVYPNTLLISAKAFAGAAENPKVLERFKYTSSDSVTAEMLARLMDVDRVVVGKAVSADAQGTFSDVWGADAVLAYVAPDASSMEEPSYGYTYTLEGHPLVEQAYYDNSAKSWIYPVTMERSPVLTGMTGGFLFQNAG